MMSEAQVQRALLEGDVLTVEMDGAGVVVACHLPTHPDDVEPTLFRRYLAAGWIHPWRGGVCYGLSDGGRTAFAQGTHPSVDRE